MTPEDIFKKWKGEAPKGATHCLIIPERKYICWFIGKDFYVAVLKDGVKDHRYSQGLDDIKAFGATREQYLLPLKPLVLENK